MITVRMAEERGRFDYGWLETHHTFAFGGYVDPEHVSFGALRVINEDRVKPGHGFPPHPHADMEILTYVLSGSLEHRDSLGNGSVIRPGEVQRMSAGTGVVHSEYNPSETEPTHLLQIWIRCDRKGLPPSYEQKSFPADRRAGRFCLLASRDGRDGSLTIHQNAAVYAATLAPKQEAAHDLAPGRRAWLQVARGAVRLNGRALRAGDGAAVLEERRLRIETVEDAEVLLFDLA